MKAVQYVLSNMDLVQPLFSMGHERLKRECTRISNNTKKSFSFEWLFIGCLVTSVKLDVVVAPHMRRLCLLDFINQGSVAEPTDAMRALLEDTVVPLRLAQMYNEATHRHTVLFSSMYTPLEDPGAEHSTGHFSPVTLVANVVNTVRANVVNSVRANVDNGPNGDSTAASASASNVSNGGSNALNGSGPVVGTDTTSHCLWDVTIRNPLRKNIFFMCTNAEELVGAWSFRKVGRDNKKKQTEPLVSTFPQVIDLTTGQVNAMWFLSRRYTIDIFTNSLNVRCTVTSTGIASIIRAVKKDCSDVFTRAYPLLAQLHSGARKYVSLQQYNEGDERFQADNLLRLRYMVPSCDGVITGIVGTLT
jgi:hypothetical protein